MALHNHSYDELGHDMSQIENMKIAAIGGMNDMEIGRKKGIANSGMMNQNNMYK